MPMNTRKQAMEYDIVCSESIDMLIEYVNSYLKDGWQCQGGIGVLTQGLSYKVFYQAMISGMKHAKKIRMMFLCSHNGMRSINFCYLQVKDVYTPDWKVKDVICLDYDKNKGKNKCSYYLNGQMKKEFGEYLKYLQSKNPNLNSESYLFTSQKQNKPYNRVSISRLFSSIYRKFNIQGASHLGRHLFVSKLVNSGVNICIVQKLANHKNISTTQHYFNYDPQMLANAVENVRV